MTALSVVIITRNEEDNIIDCIRSARLLTDDIIVVDAGSRDRTVEFSLKEGAHTHSINWKGYGYSRNFGAAQAKHNWIMALDADERISSGLVSAIRRLDAQDPGSVYYFRRVNHLAQSRFRFGNLGFEKVKRLYHKDLYHWDLSLVHEKLVGPKTIYRKLSGHLLHYGLKNPEDYHNKAIRYARLSAEKYFREHRKHGPFKKYASSFFNALKSYIIQLGFLDGRKGWIMAQNIAKYSWMKYELLEQLHNEAPADVVFSRQGELETTLPGLFSEKR